MTEFDPALVAIHGQERLKKIAALQKTCIEHGIKIVTAESLTAGRVAGALTELSGASNFVSGGFAVYSNAEKTALLGVDAETLKEHEAVSAPVARQMATGALKRSATATIAVSVTGYASTGGDESRGIVGGTVFVGASYKLNGKVVEVRPTRHQFSTNRHECREQTIDAAIELLARIVEIVKSQNRGTTR